MSVNKNSKCLGVDLNRNFRYRWGGECIFLLKASGHKDLCHKCYTLYTKAAFSQKRFYKLWKTIC